MIKTRRHRRGALLLMAAARAKNRRTRVRTARTRDSAVPKTMRAAAINRFGGPEVLSIHTLPTPKIGPREVLIALETAGIGSWDGEMRGGWSPDGRRPRFPLVLGSDGAGVIAAVGPLVRRFKVGDRVYACSFNNPKGGFHAEYVAVPEANVARVPKRLNLEQAGAIATTGLTALQGIEEALRVKKGQSIIIHGASGGVGTLAIQFAKLRGARVLAIASGPKGKVLARRLGADAVADGRTENIAVAAKRFAPKGIDAVLAFAGGQALERSLDTLRRGGKLAYPNGVEPKPWKRPGVKIVVYDGEPGVREFQRLNAAVEGAKLKVPLTDIFALAEAAKAHKRVAAGHILGKVALRIKSRRG